MSYEVLLLGLLVGCVNYCFRYLPLRLGVGNVRPTKRGATGILLDTIGITSICALLVVSTAPEVMHDARRFVPTLVGFVILGATAKTAGRRATRHNDDRAVPGDIHAGAGLHHC